VLGTRHGEGCQAHVHDGEGADVRVGLSGSGPASWCEGRATLGRRMTSITGHADEWDRSTQVMC
jgi:hypothetical protein